MSSLRTLQRQAWEIAEAQGFHEGMPPDRTHTLLRLCLVHTEVSEAAQLVKRHGAMAPGLGEELADICLRIFDLAESLAINLLVEIEEKMAVNSLRPRLYGTPGEGRYE